MEDQILKELREIRKILAEVTGTSNLPSKQRFSIEALKKASKEFRQLYSKRNAWIIEEDLHKIFKNCTNKTGEFIIEKFQFINYFKYNRSLYFNKKDLLSLKKELDKRNIDLPCYQQLVDEQRKFEEKVNELKTRKGEKRTRYKIPEVIRDIVTSKFKPDSDDLIWEHIAELKKEFKEKNFSDYIDVYSDSFAMVKSNYVFERYRNKELARQINNWCDNFNYANYALVEFHKIEPED